MGEFYLLLEPAREKFQSYQRCNLRPGGFVRTPQTPPGSAPDPDAGFRKLEVTSVVIKAIIAVTIIAGQGATVLIGFLVTTLVVQLQLAN